MATLPKYESTVRAKPQSANELAKTFWDFVKQDPNGNTFSPGYDGPVYLTQNRWNYIEIGESAYANEQAPTNGKRRISPGKVDITILKQYARDIQKPVKGNNGVVNPQGVMIPQFDMKFTIWTAQQWAQFQLFVRHYVPTPRLDPKSYTCLHPALQLHNIHAVTIWGLDGPYDGPVTRSKVFVLKCTEFSPAVDDTDVKPPDDNIYHKYYANDPGDTLTTTPGNTTEPAQPAGLNQ